MRKYYHVGLIKFSPRLRWVWMWLSLGLLSCGDGDGVPADVSVQIDPEARLLRDDLVVSTATGSLSYGLSARAPIHERLIRDSLVSRSALTSKMLADVSSLQPIDSTSEVVALTLDLENGSLLGTATIGLMIHSQDVSNVMFSLSVKKGTVSVTVDGSTVDAQPENEILTIPLQQPVTPETSSIIVIVWSDNEIRRPVDLSSEGGADFVSDLLDNNSAFFTMDYQFWPRLRGQDIVNSVTFEVTYPADKTLVMSGEKTGPIVSDDGLSKKDTWNITYPFKDRIGLALANYDEIVSDRCGNSILEIYAVSGTSGQGYTINPSAYAQVISSYCDQYRAWFGEPKFGTIRFAGVDERFDNGVSTPGLVIVPNNTWDDDGTGSYVERDFFLAHELAHQWWGNDVLRGSLADYWLFEGMADFVAGNAVDSIRGHADGQGIWLWEVEPLLSYYQEGGTDYRLVPEDTSTMEARIYIIKGAWVLRMLESVIGKDTMVNSLRQFRVDHSFAPATTDQFKNLIAQTSGGGKDWFFNEWLYGLGLLSLSEKHTEKNDGIEVTITQGKPWVKDPDQYFVMPLTVRIENNGRSKDESLQLTGIESTASFALP
jgi:aminopeptidase N